VEESHKKKYAQTKVTYVFTPLEELNVGGLGVPPPFHQPPWVRKIPSIGTAVTPGAGIEAKPDAKMMAAGLAEALGQARRMMSQSRTVVKGKVQSARDLAGELQNIRNNPKGNPTMDLKLVMHATGAKNRSAVQRLVDNRRIKNLKKNCYQTDSVLRFIECGQYKKKM
jgi:hypothetical protein